MSRAIEEALRQALNGEHTTSPKSASIRKNFSPPSYYPHKVTFRYSVQESWGGPRFVVEYSDNTIVRESVKRKSEEEMERKGYTNVVLLDVIQS